MEYRYDAGGNRIYEAYTHSGVTDKTWYVRDAQGNTLAIYGNKDGGSTLYWKEQELYGSSRLGIWTPDVAVDTDISSIWDNLGIKRYELSNHLGNVLATISDKPVQEGDHYKAELLSAQDYYPFGMLQPDRRYSLGTYRYGFNGQEKSDEINGDGNSYTAQFWEYDSRIGRRWNVDPVQQIDKSDYSVFYNNPILNTDPNGAYSRLGAAWRAIVWGGSTTYSESRHSYGVTYAGKQWDENMYNVVTAFHGSRQSFGTEVKDEYLNNLEFKEFWQRELDSKRVKITDSRVIAAGSWAILALPGGKLLGPVDQAVLYAEGGTGVAASEAKSVVVEKVVEKVLLFGKNAKGHLIKHADVLGLGGHTPQELQKLVPKLEQLASDLLKASDPALTRIGAWNETPNALFYISDGKMIVTEANGTLITLINKTSNNWYQLAKPLVKP
ncbi:hypothetical protein GO495_12085 [Chitinophaga oryziterrae]|uniref:RHS repeat-associated core domain-containing protein n=1 Tax=Chitinophaga oryziterrae TaxID=1031224 RepID=A0A6N8JAI2_9BACT|nr:hypothetical protein [Chitinophaga oryziterrae]MVT41326.1 hypothetical protein [Chitinophaga oryziterrae]